MTLTVEAARLTFAIIQAFVYITAGTVAYGMSNSPLVGIVVAGIVGTFIGYIDGRSRFHEDTIPRVIGE